MAFRSKQDPLEHVPTMRRYARSLCRDVDAADDLVHDALVRAYDGADGFRPDGSLRNWLLGIVRNSFLGDLRRRRAEDARYDALASLLTDRIEPVQEKRAYLQQTLDRFMQLPDAQREVIHLISIEGLGYQEAAALLDIPVGTVMSRLSRARAALRTLDAEAETRAITSLRIVGGKDAD